MHTDTTQVAKPQRTACCSCWIHDMLTHLQGDHVLSHTLKQCQEAALCIEPGVSFQLLALRLHGFDDSGYAKLIVPFHTVEGPNDKVHNAEVKAAFCWVLHQQHLSRHSAALLLCVCVPNTGVHFCISACGHLQLNTGQPSEGRESIAQGAQNKWSKMDQQSQKSSELSRVVHACYFLNAA